MQSKTGFPIFWILCGVRLTRSVGAGRIGVNTSVTLPAPNAPLVLQALDRREGPVLVRTEDEVFLEIDDVLAVDGFELRQNRRAGDDVRARRLREVLDRREALARRDHVVDQGDALPADLLGFDAVQPERLLLLRRHRAGLEGDGVLHVGLFALAGDHEFLHPHQAAHLIGEADALRFRRHQDVDLREALHEFGGAGHDEFGVGQAYEARERQVVGHLDVGKLALQAADLEIKVLHGGSPYGKMKDAASAGPLLTGDLTTNPPQVTA